MMNELHIARKVRQALDQGAETIAPRPLERLRLARDKALRVQRQPALGFGFAWVGATAGRVTDAYAVGRYWLPLAALVAGLVLIVQWESQQPQMTVAEAEEIDSALLSSELPINAYLDRGFDAWLKRESE
jgi:uncharacterized protein DUF3619